MLKEVAAQADEPAQVLKQVIRSLATLLLVRPVRGVPLYLMPRWTKKLISSTMVEVAELVAAESVAVAGSVLVTETSIVELVPVIAGSAEAMELELDMEIAELPLSVSKAALELVEPGFDERLEAVILASDVVDAVPEIALEETVSETVCVLV